MNEPSETFRLNVEAPATDTRALAWKDPDGVAHQVTVTTSAIRRNLPSVLRGLLRGGWQEMDRSKAVRERLRAHLLDGPDRLAELRARAGVAR